jgi:hypothetical protein
VYQSKQNTLIAKAFQTLLQNPNANLKLEALKRLPTTMYQVCLPTIVELAKDLNTKLCSQALYILSQLSLNQPNASLLQFVDHADFGLLQIEEKRKFFATLAYHRIDYHYFIDILNKSAGLFSQGDDKQQAALIALAISYDFYPQAEIKEILEKNANKKFTGALLKAGGQWGLRYLSADQKQKDGMKFILYMLSSIDEQGK